MTPLKPYLIRSIYDWVVDNNLTPHFLVDATHPQAKVPSEYIEEGKIILNARPAAIQGLSIDNESIQFNTRFSGQSVAIFIPIPAVLAVYAQENGRGMVFDPEEENDTPPPEPTPPKRSHLQIVK